MMKEFLYFALDNVVIVFLVNFIFISYYIRDTKYARFRLKYGYKLSFLEIVLPLCALMLALYNTLCQIVKFDHIYSAILGILVPIIIIISKVIANNKDRFNIKKFFRFLMGISPIVVPLLLFIYYTWWSSLIALVILVSICWKEKEKELTYDDVLDKNEKMQDEYERLKEIWPDDD